jgi:acetyltransferase-like isoleucine patch superfamily enzyme
VPIERYTVIGIVFSAALILLDLYLVKKRKISGGTFTRWLIIGLSVGIASAVPATFSILFALLGTEFLLSAVTVTSFLVLLLLIFYLDYRLNDLNDKLMKLVAATSAEGYDPSLENDNNVGHAEEKRRFRNWKFPEFDGGGMTKWNWMCQYTENLKLGKNTDIGAFTYINAKYGVEIQDNVQVGSHCSIYSWSTIDNKKGRVTLKKNAKIGSHTTIMPGVTIGENSIIGGSSFVNREIPDNIVAYGIPAKVIRRIHEDRNHTN